MDGSHDPICPSRDLTATALRVLVAEDTPTHRQLLERMLTRHGHQVAFAENGKLAVERFSSQPFDVVLMDVQMPLMDGMAATKRIRELEGASGRHTPIMGLTAQPTPEIVEQCKAAGMDACVAKPIDTAVLMKLLHLDDPASLKTTPPTAPPVEVIDIDGTLRRLGGDRDLLRDFIAIYDKDTVALAASLRAALGSDDAKVAERAAHSLRGLAANFGASAAVEVASDIEHAAKDGRLDEGRKLLDRLDREFARVSEALGKYRRG